MIPESACSHQICAVFSQACGSNLPAPGCNLLHWSALVATNGEASVKSGSSLQNQQQCVAGQPKRL